MISTGILDWKKQKLKCLQLPHEVIDVFARISGSSVSHSLQNLYSLTIALLVLVIRIFRLKEVCHIQIPVAPG